MQFHLMGTFRISYLKYTIKSEILALASLVCCEDELVLLKCWGPSQAQGKHSINVSYFLSFPQLITWFVNFLFSYTHGLVLYPSYFLWSLSQVDAKLILASELNFSSNLCASLNKNWIGPQMPFFFWHSKLFHNLEPS